MLDTSETLDEAADRLIDEANEAGGRDNITVVLSRVEEVGTATAGSISRRSSARPRRRRPPHRPTPHLPPPRRRRPRRLRRPRRPARGRLTPIPAAAPPEPERKRLRERRYIKPVAALIAVLIVLFLVGGGGYLATRQLYFVGTNSQGIVTIYRGLPYDLPVGIRLYETFFVSGVPASLVPADRRKSVFNNQLRSQTSAMNLVKNLELGKVSQ